MERLILEEFGVFMYNHGRGKEITRTEYLKWKYRKVPKDQVRKRMYLGLCEKRDRRGIRNGSESVKKVKRVKCRVM